MLPVYLYSADCNTGEVFCTVGLRDGATASEDVDIVGLSDTTAGETVGKFRLKVAADVGDAAGIVSVCDITAAGETVGAMSLLVG